MGTCSTSSAFVNRNIKPDTLVSQFLKLERVSKLEINKYWEKASLENYLEHNIVPRGLRILIFPDFNDAQDADRAQEWEENLTLNSEKMPKLLIVHADREHQRAIAQIEEIKQEIQNMTNPVATKEKNFATVYTILRDARWDSPACVRRC